MNRTREQSRIRRPGSTRAFALVVAAMLTVVACGGDVTTPDNTEVAGAYALVSVNSAALPFTLDSGTGYLLELTSDSIFINASGGFRDVTRYRQTTNGVAEQLADSISGNWTVHGSTITFSAVSGDVYTANYRGSTFIINGLGLTTVYSK
jgi:hypothetical protein